MTLAVGTVAPPFNLESDTSGRLSLASFAGKPLVLFFYPKDSTPGCTTEACDFRDRLEKVQSAGAALVGVSRDSLKSHQTFRTRHGLNYPLLSDPDGAVHNAFGAWGEKTLYGKKSIGAIRTTVLIDGEGVVRRVWSPVRVPGHADAVLAALGELTSA